MVEALERKLIELRAAHIAELQAVSVEQNL